MRRPTLRLDRPRHAARRSPVVREGEGRLDEATVGEGRHTCPGHRLPKINYSDLEISILNNPVNVQ